MRANFVRSVRSQSDCALRCASTGDTRAGRSCAPARCNALVHLRTECCAPGAARICCAFARCWRRLQAPNAVASPDSRSRPGQAAQSPAVNRKQPCPRRAATPPAFSTRSRGRSAARCGREQLLPILRLQPPTRINSLGAIPLATRARGDQPKRTQREARGSTEQQTRRPGTHDRYHMLRCFLPPGYCCSGGQTRSAREVHTGV